MLTHRCHICSRHAAVLERASTLLKHDSKKLETFRKYVSEYRTGIQTAREICDSVFSPSQPPVRETRSFDAFANVGW